MVLTKREREVLGLLLPQEAYAVPDPFRLDRLTSSGVFDLPGGGVLPARVPAVILLGLVVGIAAVTRPTVALSPTS